MDAIQSATAASSAGGFAWHFAPRARAPDAQPTRSPPADSYEGDALRFTPGKAVLHLLSNSADSFKRVLAETENPYTAGAVAGFRVDAYA